MSEDHEDTIEYKEKLICGKIRKVPIRQDASLKVTGARRDVGILNPIYEDWLKADSWDLIEAIFLIHDQHPLKADYPQDENGDPTSDQKTDLGFDQEMKNCHSLAERSIVAGKLELYDNKYVIPADFVKWAMSKELDIPKELIHLATEKKERKKRETSKDFRELVTTAYTELLGQGKKVTAFAVWKSLLIYDDKDREVKFIGEKKVEFIDDKTSKTKTRSYHTVENIVCNLKKIYPPKNQ